MATAVHDTAIEKANRDDILVVDDQIVDEVAHTIRNMHRTAALQFACEVGRLILDRFYGGDLSFLRRTGPKGVSFEKLARHPEFPMSAAALRQAVAVFLIVREGRSRIRANSTRSRTRSGGPGSSRKPAARALETRGRGELDVQAARGRSPKGPPHNLWPPRRSTHPRSSCQDRASDPPTGRQGRTVARRHQRSGRPCGEGSQGSPRRGHCPRGSVSRCPETAPGARGSIRHRHNHRRPVENRRLRGVRRLDPDPHKHDGSHRRRRLAVRDGRASDCYWAGQNTDLWTTGQANLPSRPITQQPG